MVGDRDHDVEGAHLNGIDCIGVTWGFGSVDELDGAGAATDRRHPGRSCRSRRSHVPFRCGHEHHR